MLNRLALRLATVRALRGRTNAGDAVVDSDMGAIDEFASDKPKPVIVVYTDDASFAIGDRDLQSGPGSSRYDSGFQKLVIEIAMTQRMTLTDEDGEQIETAVPPVTDAALELNLDIIEAQVIRALMWPAADAPWSELWRRLAKRVGDRDTQRGASKRDGVRFAGRQITLNIELAKEPLPGQPLPKLWTDWLALAATDTSLASVLPAIEAMLAVGENLPADRALQGAYGLTRDEAKALGVVAP